MASYEKPVQNLAIFDPQAFTANDEPLTITTGSKYFLKYPNAQGLENLQAITVNGTSLLYDNLTMSSSNPAKRVIQCGDFKLDDNAGAGGTAKLQIYTSGETNYYKSLVSSNLSSINFQLKNTGGATITPLNLTPLVSTFNTGLTANQGLIVNGNPSIFNTGINVYANSVFGGTIDLDSAENFNINNTANLNILSGGIINVRAGGTVTFDSSAGIDALTMNNVKAQFTSTKINMNTTVITQSGFCSNRMQNITMNDAANIIFNNQVGRIYQPTADALFVNRNEIRRTDVYIKSASSGGANDVAFRVYDALTGSDERGFIVYPNASSSGSPANSVIVSKDTVISSTNTLGSNNALCLTCFSSDRIGMRLDATSATNPVIGMTADTNVMIMNKTSTRFNKKFEIAINAGGASGSTSNSLDIYDTGSGANNRGIYFNPNASVGANNSLVVAGDSCIFSKSDTANSNALTLTCATTTKIGLRLNAINAIAPTVELSCSSNTLTMTSTQTILPVEVLCRGGIYTTQDFGNTVTGGAKTVTMRILANENVFMRPITFNNEIYDVIPAVPASQLGYVDSGGIITDINALSGGVRTAGSLNITKGTWIIECNFKIAPETNPAVFSVYSTGLSTSATAYVTTGSLTASNFSITPFTQPAFNYYTNTSRAVYRVTGATTPIYLNYGITYTGATNCLLQFYYTLTRIG